MLHAIRLIAILLLAIPAAAAWRAGVASAVITPKEPLWMAGYADRNHPFESVLQDLHAKALAIEDDSGAVSVLVTLDLAHFGRDVAALIAERARKHGIARERLLLNASHTHSGPLVSQDMILHHYPVPPKDRPAIERYTSWMIDQVGDVIGRAVAARKPAQLAFGQGFAGIAVNRRRVWKRELPGPVDHDVPVLSVRDANGQLMAAVFGYACHNTVLAGYEINGDYAGFAQAALQQMYPGAVAMFVTGAGADANPLPRRSIELARRYGETLANAVDQVLKARMQPLDAPLRAALEEVDIFFQPPPAPAEIEKLLKSSDPALVRRAQYLLGRLDRDGRFPDRHPYPVQVWRFGPPLTLIALGGELVVDYALRFKAAYGWQNTWVAGYSNDIFAYIPSVRVLKEGGYEGGEGPMIPYALASPFAESVEAIIVKKVDELVKKP